MASAEYLGKDRAWPPETSLVAYNYGAVRGGFSCKGEVHLFLIVVLGDDDFFFNPNVL